MSNSNEKKSLWQQVCEEYEADLPRPPSALMENSSSKSQVSADEDPLADLDPGLCQPALPDRCVLLSRPPPYSQKSPSSTQIKSPPEVHQSAVGRFMEMKVFPVLLPGLEALLKEAEKQACFQRKLTSFNPCDFLTQFLYNHNPRRQGQDPVNFHDIPFVKEWLGMHPRPPTPLFLRLSEDQAALLIQAFWRGYKVRARPDVQELRQWQKELREYHDIAKTVEQFWDRQESRESHRRGNSNLSIRVVSPTPQSTAVNSPTLQTMADRRKLLTPGSCSRKEMSLTPSLTSFLTVAESDDKPSAAASVSLLETRSQN